MKNKHINRFLEFLLVGICMGVIEDVIAVKATTGTNITFEVLITVVLVALPFAAFSELVVDRKEFNFLKSRKEEKS